MKLPPIKKGQPFVVSYGGGRDSTAVLVQLHKLGVRPDLILMADTGGEKVETYRYVAYFSDWLVSVGLPAVTVVRYRPRTATYTTLEGQCLKTEMLPSLAYGGGTCALKYKVEPMNKFCATWAPAVEWWARGGKVLKAIGYEADEGNRLSNAMCREITNPDPRYEYCYPLMDWGWTVRECVECIADAGLEVPPKSACFFCPASSLGEIVWLRDNHPDLYERSVRIERNARKKIELRLDDGLPTVQGLGRTRTWEEMVAQYDEQPAMALIDPKDA